MRYFSTNSNVIFDYETAEVTQHKSSVFSFFDIMTMIIMLTVAGYFYPVSNKVKANQPIPLAVNHNIQSVEVNTNQQIVPNITASTIATTVSAITTQQATLTVQQNIVQAHVVLPANNIAILAQKAEADPMLTCIRNAENGTRIPSPYAWGYGAPLYTGDGGGAYQFEKTTWDSIVSSLGEDPNNAIFVWGNASPEIQDAVAEANVEANGYSAWLNFGDSTCK